MISPRKRVHGPSSRREDYRTPAARRVREADYEDEDENVDEDLQREVGTMDVDGDAEEVANSTDSDDMTITERLARQRERGFSVGELSSSVVKGRAALGLLELGGGRGREWRGRGSI